VKRPDLKVAAVLKIEEESLKRWSTNSWEYRTLMAITRCRTSEMGSHIDKCTHCESLHISYNSCRNRHCPTCQGHKQKQWIDARIKELLPSSYFHVVFTIPHELNPFCLSNSKELYTILFKTAWETLKQFSVNPKHLGAEIGMIGVLHTWGQNLSLHPHLHCIIPGGGVAKNGSWKKAKSKGKYLFHVKAMSTVFRAKFVAELRKKKLKIPQSVYAIIFKKKWVVYAKPAFGSARSIVEYLGKYTHKIAISNYRILAINKNKRLVKISLKNYRKGGQKTTLTLKIKEFIRRFSLHILPKGFTRLRHYGILSSSWKKEKLPRLQALMGVIKQEIEEGIEKTVLRKCPKCKVGDLITIMVCNNKGPPPKYSYLLKNNNFKDTI
jgi:hypothetical protein